MTCMVLKEIGDFKDKAPVKNVNDLDPDYYYKALGATANYELGSSGGGVTN